MTGWHGVGAVALASLICVACGSADQTRTAVDAQHPLQAELGFVREAGVTRAQVELRLGAPAASFEQGRVVNYAVRYDAGRRQLEVVSEQASKAGGVPGRGCFGLMIRYGPDDSIAAYTLVRQGSARCPKEESML